MLGPQLDGKDHVVYLFWLDLIPCLMDSDFLSRAEPADTKRRLDVFGAGAMDHANKAMVEFLDFGAATDRDDQEARGQRIECTAMADFFCVE